MADGNGLGGTTSGIARATRCCHAREQAVS
jgi:hypothetical protein